nr:protein Spindly [Leptinotarsa decemlineata]
MANESILSDDFDNLKKDYFIIKKELDRTNQELYDCKRQLKVQEALQHEFQSEIDMLQSDEIRQKQKYQDMISHLEETISNLRSNYNEQIQTLESAIVNLEEKNVALEVELGAVKKTNSSMSFSGDTTQLIEEILLLKEDNQGFTENRDELVANLEELQHNNFELQKTLDECRMESLNLKESLECKREELLEANNLIQKLNDDKICLQTELDSLKSQPLDEKSKGNSLFAEVDDRRVYLQETINKMKSDYTTMSQERSQHLNTIHQLKLENLRLLDKWKSDSSEKTDDEDEVVKSLQYRIKALEDLLEKYKKDLESKPVVISKNNYEEIQYYQVVLNNKNKEIEDLRDEISSRSLTQILLSTSLKEANEEKRKWRLEAISKQHQLDAINSESSLDKEEVDNFEAKPNNSKNERLTFNRSDNVTRRNTGDKKELRKTTDMNNLEVRKTDSRMIYEKFQRSERDTQRDTQFRVPEFIQRGMTKTRNSEKVNEGNDDVFENNKEESNKTVSSDTKTNEDKENLSENMDPTANKLQKDQPRKVTFSENTVSPKKSSGTSMRTCKRVIVANPVYFSSKPDN